ncbi:MAG: peptidylprolyl isomerase, partial [Bacteroidota bacterium]|nr:peptidylprolyl isomerase [Bacteroidota bacterium]
VDSGLYKHSSFYRVLKEEDQPSASFKSELIQGGIWQTNYKKGSALPGVRHESTKQTGILHKNGTISLARTTPGTASSEFLFALEISLLMIMVAMQTLTGKALQLSEK